MKSHAHTLYRINYRKQTLNVGDHRRIVDTPQSEAQQGVMIRRRNNTTERFSSYPVIASTVGTNIEDQRLTFANASVRRMMAAQCQTINFRGLIAGKNMLMPTRI